MNNKGFTLIELLMYLGISATILLVISLFLALMLQLKIKNQTSAEVEQQGMFLMQTITQTIRNATSITLPTQGNSATSATLTTSSGTATFDLSSGAIRVNEGTGAVALTNSQITASNLNFQNVSWNNTSGSIRISFTLTRSNPGNRQEYNYSKTFYATATLRP